MNRRASGGVWVARTFGRTPEGWLCVRMSVAHMYCRRVNVYVKNSYLYCNHLPFRRREGRVVTVITEFQFNTVHFTRSVQHVVRHLLTHDL